jgi:ketosteroid isomerase-like protein
MQSEIRVRPGGGVSVVHRDAGITERFEVLDDGDDVAYAHALLRCGTRQELADNPENRLRLTLGLRKEHGRWVVAHEHHSFPYTADRDDAPAS